MQTMHATKISVAVIGVIVMGSTPVSSLDEPRNFARHELPSCASFNGGIISLVSAKGRGIALIPAHRCGN